MHMSNGLSGEMKTTYQHHSEKIYFLRVHMIHVNTFLGLFMDALFNAQVVYQFDGQ